MEALLIEKNSEPEVPQIHELPVKMEVLAEIKDVLVEPKAEPSEPKKTILHA